MEANIKIKNVPFLSFRETQIALDCSRGFVYGLIDKRKLTPKYIGSRPYFMVDEIIDCMADEPDVK